MTDPEALDLRIHTPGLTAEQIAAVTTVVTAMVEEQRGLDGREEATMGDRWRHSGATWTPTRGPGAWSWSMR